MDIQTATIWITVPLDLEIETLEYVSKIWKTRAINAMYGEKYDEARDCLYYIQSMQNQINERNTGRLLPIITD